MLAILTTHPIQYQIPLWQALARDGRVPFEVWHLTDHGSCVSHDREFGKAFAWDLETLSGYPHRFLDVAAGATPGAFLKCRLRERLRDRVRAGGVRAVWLQGWQVAAYWQAVWEATEAGAEVWLRGESNDLAPTPLWKRGAKGLILGQLFRRVDRFLYIGSANRRLYRAHGVPESRLYSAPYAVDNERFSRQADSLRGRRAEIRREWKIPEDTFCVLFCGKFIPKKRPMDLVAAAKQLIEREFHPDDGPTTRPFHLLFVGSGELGVALRAHCDVVFDAETPKPGSRCAMFGPRSGPRPHATFAGFLNQTEISRAYLAADCLVLPSDYGETWGLVVNEAMASGVPCVISDQCGSSVDLGSIAPNSMFPCGDVSSLADVLRRQQNSAASPSSPPSLTETLGTVVSLSTSIGIC